MEARHPGGLACPICGVVGPHTDGPPIRLTADQLIDLGLKPEDITGGTITMADQDEPKARYPKQEVAPGQKHGYIGDVETYEPAHADAGYSNVETAETAKPGKTTKTSQTAKDVTPEEPAIAGSTGLIGGTIDNVSAPKG